MRDQHEHRIPTARDVMTTALVTLHPDTTLFDAIRLMLKNQISGAPVLDETGHLAGMFSERNCLQVLTAGEFYSDDLREEGTVGNYMTQEFESVGPEIDIYSLSQRFLTHAVRRLPVLEDGELVGQVSRRDVLRAMEELGRARASRKHYPDYREPSEQVGARRSR
jgi:CBS domain-containing protein